MTNVEETLDSKVLVNEQEMANKLSLSDASLKLLVDILLGLAVQEEISDAIGRDCGEAA